jgi:hypothetical protein
MAKYFPAVLRFSFVRPPSRIQARAFSTKMGGSGAQTVHTTERLVTLRKLMKEENTKVNAFVVPSEDQRMSAGSILNN